MTSSKRVYTLICHTTIGTTIRRNNINFLCNPGHVTLWCMEVVPVVYARVGLCKVIHFACLIWSISKLKQPSSLWAVVRSVSGVHAISMTQTLCCIIDLLYSFITIAYQMYGNLLLHRSLSTKCDITLSQLVVNSG